MCNMFLHSQEIHTFEFNQNDYSFTIDNGVLHIVSSKSVNGLFYSDDITTPAFPYTSFCILRPSGLSSEGYQVEMQKELIYENVRIEATPKEISTNTLSKDTEIRIATKSVFNPVIFGGDQSLFGYNFAYFKISPFIYDANSKSLYFVSKFIISLPTTISSKIWKDDVELKPFDVEEIKKIIINPNDLERFYPKREESKDLKMQRNYNTTVDYLIVTSELLKDEFSKIARHKIKKGLHAKVLTIEEIRQNYGSSSMSDVLRIKYALYDYYNHHGLKWVLLGGDASVIPSLMCKIKVGEYMIDGTTPTDLFYACFGGSFNWDGNGNGIYGELADNISLYPNLYVSRIPARSVGEVYDYYTKLLSYENNTSSFYKILQVAYGNNRSTESSTMFQQYIYLKNGWLLDRDYMYDSSSNIPGISNSSASNLVNLIDNGNYHFIDTSCHGTCNTWDIGNSGDYSTYNAHNQTNNRPIIFTTTSCNSAEFDTSNCLASVLLCQTHGGIAYFGSSRDGWALQSGNLGMSAKYSGNFYECLFTHQPNADKTRFAAVAAEAKKRMINEANTSDNSKARWLMFSINPLGDPELQIHDNLSFNAYGNVWCDEATVTVGTFGEDSCSIAITSAEDDGESYFEVVHNVDSCVFENVSMPFYISVTKDNYAPYISDKLYPLNLPILGNTIMCGSETYSVQLAPSGYYYTWSCDNPSVSLQWDNYWDHRCTVSNTLNTPIDATLTATLWKAAGSYWATTKKRIITHPAFSVSCSQGAGSSNGNTYPAQSNIPYNANQGFIVNPCCEITLTSPNFKCMQASFSSVSPTTFNFDGDQNEAKFTLPYQSTPYTCYFNGTGDGSCNNFSIKMTVSPTPIPVLDMRTNWAGSTLNAIMGYFDAQDLTSLIPIAPCNNWNLWVYKADSGVTMFNSNVNGLKSFDTSSWASGVYVIRGVAEGQTFTIVYNH